MKFSVWFLIGCASVGVPFFAFYHRYDLWPSVTAGIAGGIFFFMLLIVFAMRPHFSMKERILFSVAHSIFLIAFTGYAVVMYQTTSYQRQTLGVIRSYIGAGIIVEDEIYRRAIPLLRSYYNQPAQEKSKSLVEVFNSLYGNKLKNSLFNPNTDIPGFHSPTWTFVQYSGDTMVKFISIDSIGKGIKKDFKGFTGLTGNIQYTAMITKGGVKYERNN